MITIFKTMLARLARGKGLHVQAFVFFMLVLSAFVFGIGNEPAQLAAILPGLVWAILLLASLLGLPDLFETDYQDGTLDDYLISTHPLPALMALKLLAHAATTGLPATLAAILAVMAITPSAIPDMPALFLGLVLGSLAFSATGVVGAALTLGARSAATLQGIVIMPLCVTPLVFGAGAAGAPALGVETSTPLFFLGAFTCAALTLAPFAAAAILRMKVTTP